jgi:hypothetical protein
MYIKKKPQTKEIKKKKQNILNSSSCFFFFSKLNGSPERNTRTEKKIHIPELSVEWEM